MRTIDSTDSAKSADPGTEMADATLKWLTWPLALSVLLVCLAVYVAFAFIAPRVHGGIETAGQFGDMFGALNAFVSGIAMFGVIVAILLQRKQNQMQSKELALQRQELAETRRELEGQRRALEEQNVHAAKQALAVTSQLAQAAKDYIERNKPVVFCDRVEIVGSGYRYVIRNVGGGFALNVYYLDVTVSTAISLGALASGEERVIPRRLLRERCAKRRTSC